MDGIRAMDGGLGALRGRMALDGLSPSRGGEVEGGRFAQALERAIESTDAQIQGGDEASRALAMGEQVGLHETMIAVERADIAFRTFSAVKNRALEAYREIMRMQV